MMEKRPMKIAWQIGGLVLVFSSVGLLALACGGDTDAAGPSEETHDGAADATPGARGDASGEAASEPVDAAPFVPGSRCAGATYLTAPSGAACDPKRIEQQRGLEGSCYGPGVGAFCRRFQVSVLASEEGALPAGFVCGSAELGVKTCVWPLGDGAASSNVLDDAALEAACAVTTALPTANVSCVNSGS
jgi:hypothetical protein